MEDFESSGLWRIASTPEGDEVVGLLKYSEEDGYRLEIPLGALGNINELDAFMDQPDHIPVLYGTLRDGKIVTLINSVIVNSTFSLPGARTEMYQASSGFIGQVEAIANPLIDSVEIECSHLRDWVIRNPSSLSQEADTTTQAPNLTYHYETPEEQELLVNNNYRLVLSHIAKYTLPTLTGFRLDHDCKLTLSFDEPVDFRTAHDNFLHPLQQFLSFCIDDYTDFTSIRVELAGQNEWLDYRHAKIAPPNRDEVIHEVFMLLSMRQLNDRIGEVIETWIAWEGDERRAVSLLVGSSADHNLPTDLRFLAAVQALEAMSRVDANEFELDEVEFQRRTDKVQSDITERRVRDWALRKLRYANQKSAGDLLLELINDIGPYVRSIAPDQNRFLADVRNNRNFYTHRDDRRIDSLLDLSELFVLTEGVILLLKAATLRKLGYSQDDINTIMDACQGTLRWRFRVAEQYPESEND